MNEHIRALAYNKFPHLWDSSASEQDIEEFVKLIINECMYVGRLAQINDQLVDLGIKEHFGIKQ